MTRKRGRPRGPRPPLDAVLAMRATGATLDEVAAHFQVKRQTIQRVLQEAGPVSPAAPVEAQEPLAPPPEPPAAAPARFRPPEEVLKSIAADERAPASQRLAASKTLLQYERGKPVAGMAVGFGGPAAPAAAAPDFDPTRLGPEKRARYLEVLKAIDALELEAEALRAEAEADGPA